MCLRSHSQPAARRAGSKLQHSPGCPLLQLPLHFQPPAFFEFANRAVFDVPARTKRLVSRPTADPRAGAHERPRLIVGGGRLDRHDATTPERRLVGAQGGRRRDEAVPTEEFPLRAQVQRSTLLVPLDRADVTVALEAEQISRGQLCEVVMQLAVGGNRRQYVEALTTGAGSLRLPPPPAPK